MKFTRRMVLIPEGLLDTLERKENIQTTPITKSIIRIDQKMDDILEDRMAPPDDKVAQYNQNLQRYLDVHEKNRAFVPTVKIQQELPTLPNDSNDSSEISQQNAVPEAPSTEHRLSEGEILDSVPKTTKALAKSMITRLKANKEHITWNDKGEITVNGHTIPGSNIIDLINDQLRERKNFDPTGWETFTESLSKINMPKYLMRNERRKSHIAQLQNTPTSTATPSVQKFSFPPTPPTTPRTSKIPVFRRTRTEKRFSDNWITLNK